MHYPADFRKTLPGPRVAAGKLQHRFQIALLPHQPHAHRIHQSEHKRDMSQHHVERNTQGLASSDGENQTIGGIRIERMDE